MPPRILGKCYLGLQKQLNSQPTQITSDFVYLG